MLRDKYVKKGLTILPPHDTLYSTMGDTYTVEVKQVDEHFIELPPALLHKLGWEEGDDINFDIRDDGSIHLKKVKLENVELNFDDGELLKIMLAAHERGLSFNELCTSALEEALTRQEFESECG